jgi:cytochrome c5
MKSTLGKTATWVIAMIAVATIFMASPYRARAARFMASPSSAEASRGFTTTQDLPEGEGKKILQNSCTACHGLDDVVSSHMDKTGWSNLIDSMISNGAQVDDKDKPVLVDYLVKNFGPQGGQQAAGGGGGGGDAGKMILENACTACHDLDLVMDMKLSKQEWDDLVKSMISKGAAVEDKDVAVLVDYLAKTYGK